MADGFVIMQIGDPELDQIYEETIAPAVRDAGLTPRRIDLDNAGGLLKSEIVGYLESSAIIVADLTNERPNCYLEVGYVMGLGRHRHLILTVRSDHLPGNPDFVHGGPKVHFDLAGYDLLMWSRDDLDGFRGELTNRIQRRLAISESRSSDTEPSAEDWASRYRDHSVPLIRDSVGPGYMELRFELEPPKIERSQRELFDASRDAVIRTFGWPIGVTLNDEASRARPTGNGIRAEVTASRIDGDPSYDFWELRTDGDFYMIQSLFEDQRGHKDRIFIDTRIVRVTEAVLYCARLYERLNVPPAATVNMRVVHGGIAGRILSTASPGRYLSTRSSSAVELSESQVTFVLGDVAAELVTIVKTLLSPLFELFDFFQLGDEVYEEIVNKFVAGRV